MKLIGNYIQISVFLCASGIELCQFLFRLSYISRSVLLCNHLAIYLLIIGLVVLTLGVIGLVLSKSKLAVLLSFCSSLFMLHYIILVVSILLPS